jgi:hypothetical protein
LKKNKKNIEFLHVFPETVQSFFRKKNISGNNKFQKTGELFLTVSQRIQKKDSNVSTRKNIRGSL